MINYVILGITALIGLAALIADLCADSYEHGARNGYDKGLEDGIRMTNEVLEEDQQTDCPWR